MGTSESVKRYNIDAPSVSQYEESDIGEWVRYEDFTDLLKTAQLANQRLLDAHAADRAALVSQLERVKRAVARQPTCTLKFELEQALQGCEVSDPTHAALVTQLEAAVDGMNVEQSRRETEQRMRESAEAQVAELTRERDEALQAYDDAFLRGSSAARAEVTRLTEALAKEEALRVHWFKAFEVQEARVRELEAELRDGDDADAGMRDRHAALQDECAALRAEVERRKSAYETECIASDLARQACQETESRLAAANALLESCVPVLDAAGYNAADIRAHLAAQPATAPARDEEAKRG